MQKINVQILDEVKNVLKPAHISLAESISIVQGKGVQVLIVWKEPVHEFELQIVDTELRNNDQLSKIVDLWLGSVINLGPAVVYSEKSSVLPQFCQSSLVADGEITSNLVRRPIHELVALTFLSLKFASPSWTEEH